MSVAYTDVQELIAFYLGWDRTVANWPDDQDNLFQTMVDQGVNTLINSPILPGELVPHQWSFLFPLASIELTANYATGTVAIASGVVTLTGGTWPSWAAQGDLWVEDDGLMRRYSVTTRDSNTQITLTDLTVTVTAGETYTLRRYYYDLPTNFGGMYSDGFTWRRDSYQGGQLIRRIGEAEVRRSDNEYLEGLYPMFYSLVPSTTTGYDWSVAFTPILQQSGFVEYRYRLVPSAWTTGTFPYGNGWLDQALRTAIVDAAFKLVRDSEEKYPEFVIALTRAVKHDRAMFGPTNLGNGDADQWRVYRHGNGSIADATLFT